MQKGWVLCQEVMVQGLAAKVPAQAGGWVEVPDAAEAEWADHLLQGRVEVVFAQAVAQPYHTLQGSLVVQKAVLNVVRK